ncbi:MAG: hypothetical protein IKF19_04840 [Bacilli bacterium]|nr:hypothetical protein [Bacilli bacterium]
MSNRVKKYFLAFLLVFLSIFGIRNVFAASAPSSLRMKYRNYDPPISFPETFHIKETTDGKYVYCATYAKKMPVTSIKYSKVGSYTDPGVNYILEIGSKVKNDKQYFIVQTAYWIYLMDKNKMNYSPSVNSFKSKINSSDSSTAKTIRQLVSEAKSRSSYDQKIPSIRISNNNISFKLSNDGKYYVSEDIVVKSSESDYKVQLVNAPRGTDYSKNGNKVTIKVPVSSVSNNKSIFSIKVSNSKVVYRSYKYSPSDSSYQVMSVTYGFNKQPSAVKKMSIAVDKVTISKQDITTKSELPGAKLEIKTTNGSVVDSWTSSKSVHEVKLNPGTYILTETIAPEGYDKSTEEIKFTVTNKGVTRNVVMYNTPTKKEVKKISISKQDVTTKEELSGASLEVKDSNGKVIDKWTSSSTPHIITDLKPGTYTLSETLAPEGYELSTETVNFEVDENGEASPVVMYNTPKKIVKPQVSISKKDSSTNQEVPGATLEVRDSSGEVIETFVSESTPYVITDIEPGTYTLVEVDAPEEYQLTDEKISFTVKEDSEENVSVVMYNTKEQKETPKEIAVPSTSSFGNIITSIIGALIFVVGSVVIAINLKKKNGI